MYTKQNRKFWLKLMDKCQSKNRLRLRHVQCSKAKHVMSCTLSSQYLNFNMYLVIIGRGAERNGSVKSWFQLY